MRRISGLLDFTIGGGGLFGGMQLTKRMQEHLQGLTIEDLPPLRLRRFGSEHRPRNLAHERLR